MSDELSVFQKVRRDGKEDHEPKKNKESKGTKTKGSERTGEIEEKDSKRDEKTINKKTGRHTQREEVKEK